MFDEMPTPEISELSKISGLAKKHGVAVITAYQGKDIDFSDGTPTLSMCGYCHKRLIVFGDKNAVQEFSDEYNDFPNGLRQQI